MAAEPSTSAVRTLVATALAEDLGLSVDDVLSGLASPASRDVTGSLLPVDARFSGVLRAREPGVVCGIALVEATFAMLSAGPEPSVRVEACLVDGARVAAGAIVARIDGTARLVLAGERSALDFLCVLSGIATRAADWQSIAGPSLAVCDTRKTVPGLRELSKYAVRTGGGTNHRHGLYDMVLIKDNHLRALGGVTAAVEAAHRSAPGMTVEVEADSVEQAVEAAAAGADMVLLDHLDDATLALAVAAVRDATRPGSRCLTEASGGVTLDRLGALALLGLDRVSAGALTIGPPLDFGLDEV